MTPPLRIFLDVNKRQQAASPPQQSMNHIIRMHQQCVVFIFTLFELCKSVCLGFFFCIFSDYRVVVKQIIIENIFLRKKKLHKLLRLCICNLIFCVCLFFSFLSVCLLVCLFHIPASIYVVRKIRASIAEGEQLEKPIITPCSATGKLTSTDPVNTC